MSRNLTIQQLAQEAIDVQDACNLVAVVNGMTRALKDLRELQDSGGAVLLKGDDALRAHPVTRAWADKIASLSGVQSINGTAIDAHEACEWLASGGR